MVLLLSPQLECVWLEAFFHEICEKATILFIQEVTTTALANNHRKLPID